MCIKNKLFDKQRQEYFDGIIYISIVDCVFLVLSLLRSAVWYFFILYKIPFNNEWLVDIGLILVKRKKTLSKVMRYLSSVFFGKRYKNPFFQYHFLDMDMYIYSRKYILQKAVVNNINSCFRWLFYFIFPIDHCPYSALLKKRNETWSTEYLKNFLVQKDGHTTCPVIFSLQNFSWPSFFLYTIT